MKPQCNSFSLNFELKIARVKNIILNSSHELFVRTYISDGSNEIVKLDTKHISSKSNLTFNQTFPLECLGTKDSLNCLKKLGSVVFELRQRRSTPPFIGVITTYGSKLLARAEMSLNNLANGGADTEIEKWVVMAPKITKVGSCVYDVVIGPPAVLISMKVEEHGEGVVERVGMKEWNEHCDCKTCVEYEFFAIEAALEAF